MKTKIINQLISKQNQTAGHCGTRLTEFNLPLKELKLILNELFKEGVITVHDNQHGKIIKHKVLELK